MNNTVEPPRGEPGEIVLAKTFCDRLREWKTRPILLVGPAPNGLLAYIGLTSVRLDCRGQPRQLFPCEPCLAGASYIWSPRTHSLSKRKLAVHLGWISRRSLIELLPCLRLSRHEARILLVEGLKRAPE